MFIAPPYKGSMKNPRSILITGGSSGIGEALALQYAAPGVFLALSGRDDERLQAVAGHCRERGADVASETIDVTDRDAMRAWIERIDDNHPLDLVIANAGTGGSGPDENSTRDIFAVNMAGVLNTTFPAVERMRQRETGQIALVSSLAGFIGMPNSPAYSSSKVMVKAYGAPASSQPG
jgi:short-subunit dehydrogenase